MADRKAKQEKRARRQKKDRERAKAPARVCQLCKIRVNDPQHEETHAKKLIEFADHYHSIYRTKGLPQPLCQDCGVDTLLSNESYWVWAGVWEEAKAAKDQFLCVGCIEKRLGRELRPDDFDCLSNNGRAVYCDPWLPRSARLKNRMGFPDDVENMTSPAKVIRTPLPNGEESVQIEW
jgi:hypothetical protein